jgi:hypothetical protein
MEFKDIDDIVEWLEPMDYDTFWDEIRPYCLLLFPRAECDQDLANGHVDEEDLLSILKSMARLELASILKLEWRIDVPMITLH